MFYEVTSHLIVCTNILPLMWNATPTLYFLGRELEDHISNISHCLKKKFFFLII